MPNPPNTPPEGAPAGDDYGIRNDQILDLCDYIVRKLWERVFIDSANRSGKEVNIDELHKIADTLATTWALTSDILEIDAKLKWILEHGQDEQEEDGEDDGNDGNDGNDDDDNEMIG